MLDLWCRVQHIVCGDQYRVGGIAFDQKLNDCPAKSSRAVSFSLPGAVQRVAKTDVDAVHMMSLLHAVCYLVNRSSVDGWEWTTFDRVEDSRIVGRRARDLIELVKVAIQNGWQGAIQAYAGYLEEGIREYPVGKTQIDQVNAWFRAVGIDKVASLPVTYELQTFGSVAGSADLGAVAA